MGSRVLNVTNVSYPPLHPSSGSRPLVLTPEDFAEAYPSEGQYIEWKKGPSRNEIQRAVVAFSNADGGVVMLGVDDRGTVIGKRLDDGLEKKIWEIIHELESPGPVDLHGLRVGNVDITVISVARREDGIAQKSDGTLLIRRGKQNLPLTGGALVELVSQRERESFDGGPSRWSLLDADRGLLADLCRAFEIDPTLSETDVADALQERGMVVRRAGSAMLTKAGALFLVPAASKEFGKCFVEVFRFPEGATEHDQRTVFDGTPAQQVEATTAKIDEELGFDLVVVGLNRHELKRLPVRALREVVANAVAHRDYQLSGSAVEVHVTPREVMVKSPGGFISPVNSENLRNAHAARNRQVINALRAFDLAEDAGRGIRVILDEMAADLRSEPTFAEEIDGHVTVRLPVESPVSPEERAWVREQEGRTLLHPEDRRVLIEAARGVELTNTAARELLDIDSTRARRSLQRLRDAGFLQQVGEGRGTRYRIVPSMQRSVGIRLDRTELRSIILGMAADGAITNAMVRSRLGLSRSEVVRLLGGLTADGYLELRGTKRGAHYVLA